MSADETIDPLTSVTIPPSRDAIAAADPQRLAGLMDVAAASLPPTSGSPTVPPHDSPAPVLPGYRLVRTLGRGGMGIVWLAMQEATRREVALKIVGGRFTGADARARFEREVQLAARLEHPSIARVYDSGVADGICFYAMELIDGPDLQTYAEQIKADDAKIVQLMIEVCRGVQQAHLRGIIHRDLKPGNVLVGKDGQPKVTDFGLAKLVQPDPLSPQAAITIEGSSSGTPGFMAPEQARGDDLLMDTRTDVFALGAMLFTLLCRQSAYDLTGTLYDVLHRIAETEPRRPRSLRPDMDRDLEAIIVRAMAVKPEDRYGSAGELADELQRYLNLEPILARRQTTIYLLGKALRKHRLKVAAVAVLIAAAIGGMAYSHVLIVRQKNEAVAQRDRAVAAEQTAIKETQIAEDNLQTADNAVHEFLARVGSRSLREVPGVRPLRAQFLQDAADYYRTLLARKPGDPESVLGLGSVLGSQAELASEAQQWKQATGYDQDLVTLLRSAPQTPQTQKLISTALAAITQYSYHGGTSSATVQNAKSAIQANETLAKSASAGTPASGDLNAAMFLSKSLATQGDYGGAIHQSLATIAELKIKVATNPIENGRLCFAFSDLADQYTSVRDEPDAIAASDQAITHQQLLAGNGQSYKNQLQLSRAYSDYGQRLSSFGKYDAARVQDQKAIDIDVNGAFSSSQEAERQIGIGRSYSEMSRAWMDQGNFAQAEAPMKIAVAAYEKAAAGEPNLGEGAFGLAFQLTLSAECDAGLGREDSASAQLARAAAIAKSINPDPRESRRSRQLYSRLYVAKATVLARFNHRTEALQAADQAMPILLELGAGNFKTRAEVDRVNKVYKQFGRPIVQTTQPVLAGTWPTAPAVVDQPPAANAPSGPVLDPTDAASLRANLGQIVVVHGKVSKVGQSSNGRIIFINFENSKKGDFCGVIFIAQLPAVVDALHGPLEKTLVGQTIDLTGELQEYKATLEIEVSRPDQIHIVPDAPALPTTKPADDRD